MVSRFLESQAWCLGYRWPDCTCFTGATGGSSFLAKVGGLLGYATYKQRENKKSKEE